MVAAKRIKQLVQLAAVGLLLLTFLIFTQWEDVTSGTRLQRRSFGVGEQDDEELLALEKELDVDRILKEIQKNVSLGLQKKKQERHDIVLNHRRRLVNKGNDSEDSPFTTRSPHLEKPEPKLDQSRDKPLKDTKASRERTHRRHLKTFKWRTEPWGSHMFGQLNVHVWQAWCGNTIHDLRRNWFFPLYPDLRLSVSRFYVKHYESDYGQRIFGYLHPPLTGKYLFALSSDDTSELWLSTDEHPENVKPVAWVGNLTSFSGSYRTNVAEFTKYSTQLSRQIYLKKGQKYFVEALHKQGARQDHILVGWKIPGLPGFRYITGNSISMYIYDPNASPDVAKYAGYIPQTMPSHTHSHNWSVVLDREVHKFGTNKEPEVEHHKTRPPFLNFDYLFYKCKYEPSYLVKNFTLRRYEGVGLIHDSAVYPDDNTALTHMRPFDTCGHHRRYTDSHGNNLNITTSKHRNRTLYSEGSIKVFGPDGEGSVVTMSSDLSDAYPVEGDSLNGEQTSDKPIFRSMEERVRTIAEAYKDFNNSRTEQVQYDTIKPNDPRTSSHGNTNHFDPSNVNDEKTVVNIKKRSINDDNVVPKESNSQHRGAILNIAKRIHERLKQPLTRPETSDNNAVNSIKSHMDQAALSDAGNTYRQQSPITFQTYLPSIQELQGELTAKHSDQIVNQKKQDSRQVHQGSRQVYQDSKQFRRDSQQTHQDAQQVNQDSKQARRDSKQVYQDAQQVNQDSKHVNRDAQRAHQYARQVNQYSQQVYQDSKQFDQDAQQVKQDSKHVNRVTQQSHQGAQQVYQDSQQVYQDARQVHQDSRQVHQDSKQVYQDSKQVHQDARQVHQDSQQVYQDSKQVQQDSQKVQIRRATLRKLMAISVASQTQQVLPQPSKPFQTGQGTVYFHPGLKLNNSVLSKDSALLRVYSAREYIRRMQKLVQIYKYDVTSKQLSDQIYRRFGVRMQVPELRYYRDYNPWLYNQNITKCGTDGNVLLNENVAQSVVMRYMKSVDRVRPHKFKLERIINVQENHDVIKGDRYLIELELFHFETERKARVSQYVYQEMGYTDFCSPQNFHIRHHATVHVIIPVKNQGRWVQYFIDNMSELFVKTGDPHLNVIIVDFSSDDIDINEALKRSPLVRYRVITLSGPFQRAFGIQAGAAVISNPNDIVFMCDLHLEIPNNMIDIIRKHCIQGRMAFAPIVLRLHCGFTPTIPYGFWELQGYGLFAMYKSDFDRVGGMNYREFGTRWGGEDWELLDRVLLHKMEVERLRVPNFYHFHHSKKGMWGSPTIDVIHSDIGAQYYKNRNQIIPLYRPRKYIQIRPIRYSNTIKTKDKQRNLRVKRVPSRIVRYSSRVRRGYRPKQKPRGTDKNGAKIYY